MAGNNFNVAFENYAAHVQKPFLDFASGIFCEFFTLVEVLRLSDDFDDDSGRYPVGPCASRDREPG